MKTAVRLTALAVLGFSVSGCATCLREDGSEGEYIMKRGSYVIAKTEEELKSLRETHCRKTDRNPRLTVANPNIAAPIVAAVGLGLVAGGSANATNGTNR